MLRTNLMTNNDENQRSAIEEKKQPLFGRFFKKLQCVFSIFTFSNWLFKPVQPWIFASLSFTWRGTVSIQPVCPKVLVKCKSSNIQHENVGEWFEFLRQIPFVNIAIIPTITFLVSNCSWCQIVPLHLLVSNCPRCQIVRVVKLSHHPMAMLTKGICLRNSNHYHPPPPV